jgi:hypothetical protein
VYVTRAIRRPDERPQRTRASSGTVGATNARGAARRASSQGRSPEGTSDSAHSRSSRERAAPTTASAARSAAATTPFARSRPAMATTFRTEPIEQPPEIEPLHEREHETVLERSVHREVDEQVLRRGEPTDLARAFPGSRDETGAVERKEARAGGDAVVKLKQAPGQRVEEGPGVVRPSDDGEALQLQQVSSVAPPLRRQQVDIRHRTIALAFIKLLGERGSLQRKRRDTLLREH